MRASDYNRRFILPGFILGCRDLTDEESQANRAGIAEKRDYIAVDIRHKKTGDQITLCVGSPIIMMQGESWGEAAAARSAISFASAPWCADDPKEKAWMRSYGEDLTNDAFCHGELGKEMRSE